MAFVMVPVTGKFSYQDGTPAAGQVEFTLTAAIHDSASDEIRTPHRTTVQLDAAGAFATSLTSTQSAGIEPAGVTYTVVERIAGSPVRTYSIAI